MTRVDACLLRARCIPALQCRRSIATRAHKVYVSCVMCHAVSLSANRSIQHSTHSSQSHRTTHNTRRQPDNIIIFTNITNKSALKDTTRVLIIKHHFYLLSLWCSTHLLVTLSSSVFYFTCKSLTTRVPPGFRVCIPRVLLASKLTCLLLASSRLPLAVCLLHATIQRLWSGRSAI